ncbi:MAG TPA: hypothetical protein VHG51_07300, partial [Longimicrobiaceae bacterium]|nr:hypothetical protein [Longimicrobiaceae bacterium]
MSEREAGRRLLAGKRRLRLGLALGRGHATAVELPGGAVHARAVGSSTAVACPRPSASPRRSLRFPAGNRRPASRSLILPPLR